MSDIVDFMRRDASNPLDMKPLPKEPDDERRKKNKAAKGRVYNKNNNYTNINWQRDCHLLLATLHPMSSLLFGLRLEYLAHTTPEYEMLPAFFLVF